ncbi:MAG: hypothetical protein FJY10_09990 [Bacteroidetes bacterium]|nr:hypothetical protein [Bacteroidota bacterium]
MQRKFLTNLGLLLFLNLLVKPFWIFGIDRTVQNVTGVSDYGFYFVILNFSFLFNILLDFGITNYNNRNIAQHNQLLNKHFSGILVMKFLLSVVYFMITFLIALLLGYNLLQMKFLVFLAINQFLVSLILYLRSNISGLLLFKTDSFLSVLDRLLMIAICSVLLWGGVTRDPFRIEWFIYAQTVAYLLTALICLVLVIRKAHFRRLSWNWPFFIVIIKQSMPFALLILLMTFYNRLDAVMLEGILDEPQGYEQAGIYASGYRLLDAANMIGFLFAALLLPIFSKMIKNKECIEGMVRLSFTLMITIAVIVSVGSFFYSYELMDLLYDAHVAESSSVFHWLMGCYIFISTSYIFGTLLTANGNLKYMNLIALLSLVLNVSLNLILIPSFLAVGSAFASLVTQSVSAILQVLLVKKLFRMKVNYSFLFTLLLFVGGVILLNYISRFLAFRWEYCFILAIVLSFILAAALRLVSLQSLKKILLERPSA